MQALGKETGIQMDGTITEEQAKAREPHTPEDVVRDLDMGYLKLFAKPVKRMTKEELQIERDAHAWLARLVQQARGKRAKHLHYLNENLPLYEKDELCAMFERGEIDAETRNHELRRTSQFIKEYQKTEAQIELAARVTDHHRALAVACDEQYKMLKTRVPVRKNANVHYNPRKRTTMLNRPKKRIDDKPWRGNLDNKYRPRQRIMGYVTKTSMLSDVAKKASGIMNSATPVSTWSLDKLRLIAHDRGFPTDAIITGAIAQEMCITISGAETMLRTGRMTWGQIMVIGSLFEMTPAEFCDTFLHGYFKETADGKWTASINEEEKFDYLTKAFAPKSPEPMEEAEE